MLWFINDDEASENLDVSNESLIQQLHNADLPSDIETSLAQFIAAVTALRDFYPDEFVYRVNFGERTLLRELLDPDSEETHWWQTGLYIIREGIREHPELEQEFGQALTDLHPQLTTRLGPYDAVALREINADTVNGICLLSELMEYPQNTFVAPNSYSLAQAMFNQNAWFRAVYAGKSPVGFVMLDDDPEKQVYYLWRFMIAPQFQKQGFGAKAIARVIDYVKTRPGARELLLGYIPHEQGPAEFYRRLGFSETGEIEDGEVEMRLVL